MSLLALSESEALLLSPRIAAVAVTASLPFALAAAALLARGRFVLDGLIHLPLVLPPVGTGFLLLMLLGAGRWDRLFSITLPLARITAGSAKRLELAAGAPPGQS
ncbi:MAG TPA: hypothetical protein VHZ32_08250 [Rhizomicrobium sp.]|nr:hypothetical protein [Rhizomicrobium sp.]